MTDFQGLKTRVQELAAKTWNRADIEAHYRRLVQEGIPERKPEDRILADRRLILERIQSKGEEYEFLSHS
jgi:hypothetical protein